MLIETESGDLLEAYRDSVYPQRGSWRANLWFIRQVAGYALRMRTTRLGNWILAGLLLCVFITAFSAVRYPELIPPLAKHLGLMCASILIYTFYNAGMITGLLLSAIGFGLVFAWTRSLIPP